MPDKSDALGRARSPDASDRLIGRILRAESDAEAALEDARRRCAAVVERARTGAQAIERRTDMRLEACRAAYSAGTDARVRTISDADLADGGADRSGPDTGCKREAALSMARRLVGLDP